MAIALDVANIGRNSGDHAGASAPNLTLTTSSAVTSGARLYVAAGITLPGSAGTIGLISGGGLTWNTSTGNNIQGAGALFWADCPSGLASSTVLTIPTTGSVFDWAVCATSYSGVGAAETVADVNQAQFIGTAWTSDSTAISAGSMLISAAFARDPTASTPTGPTVEDNERAQTGTVSCVVTINRRIEASGGSYTNAGTMNASQTCSVVCTRAFVVAGGVISKNLVVATESDGSWWLNTKWLQPTIYPMGDPSGTPIGG